MTTESTEPAVQYPSGMTQQEIWLWADRDKTAQVGDLKKTRSGKDIKLVHRIKGKTFDSFIIEFIEPDTNKNA